MLPPFLKVHRIILKYCSFFITLKCASKKALWLLNISHFCSFSPFFKGNFEADWCFLGKILQEATWFIPKGEIYGSFPILKVRHEAFPIPKGDLWSIPVPKGEIWIIPKGDLQFIPKVKFGSFPRVRHRSFPKVKLGSFPRVGHKQCEAQIISKGKTRIIRRVRCGSFPNMRYGSFPNLKGWPLLRAKANHSWVWNVDHAQSYDMLILKGETWLIIKGETWILSRVAPKKKKKKKTFSRVQHDNVLKIYCRPFKRMKPGTPWHWLICLFTSLLFPLSPPPPPQAYPFHYNIPFAVSFTFLCFTAVLRNTYLTSEAEQKLILDTSYY